MSDGENRALSDKSGENGAVAESLDRYSLFVDLSVCQFSDLSVCQFSVCSFVCGFICVHVSL